MVHATHLVVCIKSRFRLFTGLLVHIHRDVFLEGCQKPFLVGRGVADMKSAMQISRLFQSSFYGSPGRVLTGLLDIIRIVMIVRDRLEFFIVTDFLELCQSIIKDFLETSVDDLLDLRAGMILLDHMCQSRLNASRCFRVDMFNVSLRDVWPATRLLMEELGY